MNYIDYIKLGFKRTEMDDEGEHKRTGYYGFSLEYKISEDIIICANSTELNKPLLYIRRKDEDRYHIIPLPDESVEDIVISFKNYGK